MNREQAEHILEAYINMECAGGDNNARAALREVILDAMTGYIVVSYPTVPGTHTWTTPTIKPPTITCNDCTVGVTS